MHAFVEVDLLGIDVAIEMDDAHLLVAQVAADAAHGGEADRMVAAEDDREGATGEHVGDAFGDLVKRLFVVGRDREDVTDIAELDLLAQIHAHFVVVGRVEG